MILARREELRQGRSERNGSGFISTATAQKNAQLNAYEARQNRVLENNPTVETKPPIYTTLKRCQRQLDGGVAVVGVVVNPEGKIVSELDFLDKQGAAGIEQAAKDYVKDYQFPRTDNTTNQYFHLQFKYDTDNCSERTFKRLLENTNTKQPQ
jgi:outer membrane biosynthesis protein TonB